MYNRTPPRHEKERQGRGKPPKAKQQFLPDIANKNYMRLEPIGMLDQTALIAQSSIR